MDHDEAAMVKGLVAQAIREPADSGGASSSAAGQPIAQPQDQAMIDEDILQALGAALAEDAELPPVNSSDESLPPPWSARFLAWEGRQRGPER